MEKNDLIRKMARELGKRGGTKTREKYGSDFFRKLQQKSAESRRARKIEDK